MDQAKSWSEIEVTIHISHMLPVLLKNINYYKHKHKYSYNNKKVIQNSILIICIGYPYPSRGDIWFIIWSTVYLTFILVKPLRIFNEPLIEPHKIFSLLIIIRYVKDRRTMECIDNFTSIKIKTNLNIRNLEHN